MKFTNELRGVKSRLLLFSVLLLIPVMMFAQSITVKGTVLDSAPDGSRFCDYPRAGRIFCSRRDQQTAEHNQDYQVEIESGIGNRRFPADDVRFTPAPGKPNLR